MTYLPLAKALDKFELKHSTLVTCVVHSDSTITGVEVETDNRREIININDGGKVILTAGAVGGHLKMHTSMFLIHDIF